MQHKTFKLRLYVNETQFKGMKSSKAICNILHDEITVKKKINAFLDGYNEAYEHSILINRKTILHKKQTKDILYNSHFALIRALSFHSC